MFFHGQIWLQVDDLEKSNFDRSLNFRSEFVPEVGVGGRTEIGEAES